MPIKVCVVSLLYAAVLSIVVGCQHSTHRALQHAPNWFLDRDIEPGKGQILGYGYGLDYDNAKVSALNDIADQISVKLNSTLNKTTTTGLDGVNTSHHAISISTDVLLENLNELKKVVRTYGVYVVFNYQPSSLVDAIVSLIGGASCEDISLMSDSSFLQYTPAYQALHHKLGCFPELTLWFRNNRWHVQYMDKYAQISSEDIKQFYTGYKNPNVVLQLTDAVVENEGLYQLLLTARKEGYMSLLQISAEGSSQLLLDNVPVTSGDRVSYPDKHQYLGLQAINEMHGVAIKDLIVVALCTHAMNIPPLAPVHDTALTTDNRQFFPYLIQELDACDVSTQFLTILPAKEA